MIPRLIVIEGADGVGKRTQSDLLCTKLRLHFAQTGKRVAVLKISFPNYESDSSYFVKKFLSGNFPKSPIRSEVYAVSCSYAIDRYLTWNYPIPIDSWEEFCHIYCNENDPNSAYDLQSIVSYRDLFEHPSFYGFSGCVIIADRYMHSNWMYQVSRMINDHNEWLTALNPEEERKYLKSFIQWSTDLEVKKFGLPGQFRCKTFYLSLSEEIAKRNRLNRYQNRTDREDILERDEKVQTKVRELAEILCEEGYMEKIICYDNSLMLPKDAIQEMLLNRVLNTLFPSEERSQ